MNGMRASDGARVPGWTGEQDDRRALVGLDPEELRTQRAIARAVSGDHDALRYLYTRYAEVVRRYVAGLLGDAQEAEDITQTVFLKLMTRLDRYEPRGARFDAWLLRVARNVAFDEVRRRRPVPAGELLEDDSRPGAGFVEPDEADRWAVQAALDALPDGQREVVLLRHVIGLSPGEIAERMGRTEASVHNLHHRGRASLRRALSEQDLAPAVAASARARRGARPVPEDEIASARTSRARRFERLAPPPEEVAAAA